jgi:hypothetical protein
MVVANGQIAIDGPTQEVLQAAAATATAAAGARSRSSVRQPQPAPASPAGQEGPKREIPGPIQEPLAQPVDSPHLYAIIAFLALALAWSFWAELDQVSRAPGQVIPTGRLQVIQSTDGGQIDKINVREGDSRQEGPDAGRARPGQDARLGGRSPGQGCLADVVDGPNQRRAVRPAAGVPARGQRIPGFREQPDAALPSAARRFRTSCRRSGRCSA